MKNLIFLFILIFFISCSNKNSELSDNENNSNKLSGIVIEVKNVSKYTYVKIKNSDNEEIWLAGPLTSLKKAEKISVSGGMLMKNFKSETLNKTFEKIYFVNSLKGNTGSVSNGSNGMNDRLKRELNKNYKIKKIEKASDGYTIEEIYKKLKELNGKKVKVRGQVVKFSKDIMNRNWVHLRDGSGKTNNNDLTVTTNEIVKEGDIVTFEGILSADKDFGYGYKYKAIIENSELKR